jgi:hypothetical protein
MSYIPNGMATYNLVYYLQVSLTHKKELHLDKTKHMCK